MSPHGHCDPAAFADDRPFDSPATELVTKDHYILRMLYSQGVPLETLGVEPLDGSPAATDGQADLAGTGRRATPSSTARRRNSGSITRSGRSSAWRNRSGAKNADAVYDEISARLTKEDIPAARALRALRHRVPGDDRRRPRSTGVARAAPPIGLGRTRRAHLPPRRRGRPRQVRLPRPRSLRSASSPVPTRRAGPAISRRCGAGAPPSRRQGQPHPTTGTPHRPRRTCRLGKQRLCSRASRPGRDGRATPNCSAARCWSRWRP